MPWKAMDPVNLRREFVLRSLAPDVNFAALCREFGISRKVGYKWQKRFLEKGNSGLADESRRPASSPTGLDEETVCRIVKLKQAHPAWGPRKIRAVFARTYPEADAPSESSFKRVLSKAGLVERRRRRKSADSGRIENRVEAERPNQVWTVDFKGWWRTADRGKFEPLTVRDAYSRFLLCAQAFGDARCETVRRAFERLFAERGLPEVIRSDNGTPFACTRAPWGLTRLSAWWLALGVDLDRIEPARPDQNGAHERMHRDIAWELERDAAESLAAQQAALDVWRREYNEERPHESLGLGVPAEFYKNSSRKYPGSDVELRYASDVLSRRVMTGGQIRLEGARVLISTALSGWDVGLKREAPRRYGLWFGRLRLGEVDLETRKFTPVQHG